MIDSSISDFPAAWQRAWGGISTAFRLGDSTNIYAISQLNVARLCGVDVGSAHMLNQAMHETGQGALAISMDQQASQDQDLQALRRYLLFFLRH